MDSVKQREKDIRRLYGKGLTDWQIARRLGITPVTVRYWRHKLGLLRRPHRKVDPDEFRRLFEQGLSTWDIAKRLNICYRTALMYKYLLGLTRPRYERKYDRDRLKELWLKGYTAREIARELGMPGPLYVYHLARELDLPRRRRGMRPGFPVLTFLRERGGFATRKEIDETGIGQRALSRALYEGWIRRVTFTVGANKARRVASRLLQAIPANERVGYYIPNYGERALGYWLAERLPLAKTREKAALSNVLRRGGVPRRAIEAWKEATIRLKRPDPRREYWRRWASL